MLLVLRLAVGNHHDTMFSLFSIIFKQHRCPISACNRTIGLLECWIIIQESFATFRK